jgi:ligand-binding sensor domain-containing protein
MREIKIKKTLLSKIIVIVFLIMHLFSCYGQVKENAEKEQFTASNQIAVFKQKTLFPQIHTNLNGMVREFVRAMHQDTKGNYWFGTNGNGIIRYNARQNGGLEAMTSAGLSPHFRVMEIVEDRVGNVWFATSDGLIKYNGKKFATYSRNEGLQGLDEEIWGLAIDSKGLIWVGGYGGVYNFDGEKFISFPLPDTVVENAQHMLSDKLVFKIIEDKSGTIWFATDGNGVFKYNKGRFTHLTSKSGLTDNNTADILEDKQGNIWIATFYGGISKFDGKTYTNFTKDGMIKGEETGGLYEDSKGNIWFTAENVGVYKYDGRNFTLYTTENGLTSNVVLNIFEDKKGQLWFSTWQGMCIFDGERFVNAKDKEPWTK